MRELSNQSVDLVVTSPPYPMIAMWDELFTQLNPLIGTYLEQNEGKKAFKLMHQVLNGVWNEVDKVLKPGGFVCINIGDATRTLGKRFQLFSNHAEIMWIFEEMGYSLLPHIIWRKQTNKPNKFMGSGMMPAGAYVTLEHEYVLIFRKEPRRKFNEEEMERRRRSALFWHERNQWYSDIWFDLKGESQFMEHHKSRERSAAFPFELAYRLINMYSIQGDVVLDPFLGTGTTILASIATARNSIGYELDTGLADIIDSKLKNAKEIANTVIRNRLDEHREFVKERLESGKEMKHEANYYGFPVISNHSKDLLFPTVDTISGSRDFNTYMVIHSLVDHTKFENINSEALENHS